MRKFNLTYMFIMALYLLGCSSTTNFDQTKDISIPDKQGGNPLLLAIYNKEVKLANSYILNGKYINQTRSDGVSPLMLASIANMNEVAENLLKNKASVNAVTIPGKYGVPSGMTALMFASEQGNDFIVNLLLSEKADIYSQDITGMTPLMYAVKSGNLKTVKLLVEAGAFDYHVVNKKGHTAINIANIMGHRNIFNYLQQEYSKTILKQLPSMKK